MNLLNAVEGVKYTVVNINVDDDVEYAHCLVHIPEIDAIYIGIRSRENHEEINKKLKELNDDLRHTYAQIMMNENMTRYNEAKTEVDNLVQRITTIIAMSAEGEDPETCDIEASCSGNCASCGGCH